MPVLKYRDPTTGEFVPVPQSIASMSGYATEAYVDAADANKVDKAGDTMTGSLTVQGNVQLGSSPAHSVSLGAGASFDANGAQLSDVGTPSVASDAATKGYADGAFPTKTGSGASGTWPISISGNAAYASSAGNADTTDGLHVHGDSTQNQANKIVRTNGNGYIYTGYIHNGGDERNNSKPAYVWGGNGSDSFMRSYNSAQFASASHGNHVTGWATSVVTAGSDTRATVNHGYGNAMPIVVNGDSAAQSSAVPRVYSWTTNSFTVSGMQVGACRLNWVCF
jgi:hypothetical protein